MFRFIAIFIVVFLHLRDEATPCTEKVCDVDKFLRISCPNQDDEAENEAECMEFTPCCWNNDYTGVPNCYLSPGDSECNTTTLPTTNDVSTAGGTTTDTVQKLVQSLNGENLTLYSLNDALDTSLTAETSQDEMDLILQEVLGLVWDVRADLQSRNESIPTLSWIDLFDDIVLANSSSKTVAEMLLNVSSTILIDELLGLSDENHTSLFFTIVDKIESYAIAMTPIVLADVIANENNVTVVSLDFENALISSCEIGDSNECNIATNDVAITTFTTEVNFATFVTYKRTDLIVPGTRFLNQEASFGSVLQSVSLHNGITPANDLAVDLTFRKLEQSSDTTESVCAFIDSSEGNWSSFGCAVAFDNATHITCSCDHNTSFAMLFLHTDLQFTAEEHEFFNVITYVGSGTSITALLLTIFTFLYLKLTKIKRVVLHLNLATTLCFGQIVLLIGTRMPVGTPQCKVVAIMLHYFFMASFSWMLMEGVLLYYQSVRAINGQVNFSLMIVFGWVLPLVIVGISLAAGYDGYGTDQGCWLSIRNGLTWAFIGPALGFIVINLIMMCMIVQVFLKLKTNAKSGEWERTKRTLRAIAVLTPLFGVTWVLGALAVNEATKWFLYLFAVFNSLQGVAIFILHCLRNDDVRRAFMKKYRKSSQSMAFFTSVTPSNSDVTYVKSTSMTSPGLPKKVRW